MKKEKLLLLTLAAIQFTSIMDFMIVMPLGPQLIRLFQINPRQFSFIVASYTFSAGIIGFMAAFVIDKFDRKKALFIAYIGFIIGTLACAMAPTYHFLLAARILTGAFGGVLGALIMAIIGDTIPFERRGAAMGTVMAAFSIASVFGVPFGLYLANLFSWHAPFYFLGIVGSVNIIFITLFVPSMDSHKENRTKNPFEIIGNITSDKNQLFALLFMMLLMLGQFSIIPFISPYMVSNVGFSEHDLTYIYLIGGGLTIFSSPVIGKMADKYGKLRVFTVFACIVIIPLALITNLHRVAMPLVLMTTSLFFVCAGGRMIPASAMITATVKPQNRGSFMSINASVQQLSSGLASFIAGAIIVKGADGELYNYQYVGYIAIAATIIAIFVARKLRVVDAGKPQQGK